MYVCRCVCGFSFHHFASPDFPVEEFFCYDESPVQIRISSCNRVFSAVLCFPFCLSSKFFYLMSLAAVEMLQIPWTLTDTAVETPENKMPFDQKEEH